MLTQYFMQDVSDSVLDRALVAVGDDEAGPNFLHALFAKSNKHQQLGSLQETRQASFKASITLGAWNSDDFLSTFLVVVLRS